MNDGYLYLIISWLLIILIGTGWLGGGEKNGEARFNTRRIALLIILVMIVCTKIFFPLHEQMVVNVGSILIPGLLFLYFYWKQSPLLKTQMVATILFIGIFYAVAYEMFMLDPILMILPPVYFIPLLLSLFVLLTTQPVSLQWLMGVGGMILGECIHKGLMLRHVQTVYVGDALFRDQLAVGMVMVFGLNALAAYGYKAYQFILRLRTTQNKQEGS